MGLMYQSEFRRIWADHVPQRGQSHTIEGELVRAIEKLADEALRNGNVNWDNGHERLIAFVRERLLDPQVFPPQVIEQSEATLNLISDPETPQGNPELYDELLDRAIEYFYNRGSLPHRHDPQLHR